MLELSKTYKNLHQSAQIDRVKKIVLDQIAFAEICSKSAFSLPK
jgi:hypothetical protein